MSEGKAPLHSRYLNIGCGATFHPAWTNIDMHASSPGVAAVDIRNGLPFIDSSFDVVYHSHIIEHLSRNTTHFILLESARVLKPGGIMRIVAPDLELLAQTYLQQVDKADAGPTTEAGENYEWALIALIDQLTRSRSGGEMQRYLTSPNRNNREFIVAKAGLDAEKYFTKPEQSVNSTVQKKPLPLWTTLRNKLNRYWILEKMAYILGGKKLENAVTEGIFRMQGEIHRWMYDRYSIKQLLLSVGLTDISMCDAKTSKIPDFTSYQLDIVNGRVRKADSFFMEGIKK